MLSSPKERSLLMNFNYLYAKKLAVDCGLGSNIVDCILIDNTLVAAHEKKKNRYEGQDADGAVLRWGHCSGGSSEINRT